MSKPPLLRASRLAIAILLSILCVDLASFWSILEINNKSDTFIWDLVSISLKLGFILLGLYRWHRQETDPAQDRNDDQTHAPESLFPNKLTIIIIHCLILLISLLRTWFSKTRWQGSVLAGLSCMMGLFVWIFDPSLPSEIQPQFYFNMDGNPGNQEGANGSFTIRNIIFHLGRFLRSIIQCTPLYSLIPASLILLYLVARYVFVMIPIDLREVVIVFSMAGISLISAVFCLCIDWPIKQFAGPAYLKAIFMLFHIFIAVFASSCKSESDVLHSLNYYMICTYLAAASVICTVSIVREHRPAEQLVVITPGLWWNIGVATCFFFTSISIIGGITVIDMQSFKRATDALSRFQKAHSAVAAAHNTYYPVSDKSLVGTLPQLNDEFQLVATTVVLDLESDLTSILTDANLPVKHNPDTRNQLPASIDSLILKFESDYYQTDLPEVQYKTDSIPHLEPITGHVLDIAPSSHFNTSDPDFECLKELKQVQTDSNNVVYSLNDSALTNKPTKLTFQNLQSKKSLFRFLTPGDHENIWRNFYDILTGTFFQQYANMARFLKSYKKLRDNSKCVNSLKKLLTCADQPDQHSQCNSHSDDFLQGFDEFVEAFNIVNVVQWVFVGFAAVTMAFYAPYDGKNAFHPAYRLFWKDLCLKTWQFFLQDNYGHIREILEWFLDTFPIDYVLALILLVLSIVPRYWTPVPTIIAYILTVVIGRTIPHVPKPVAENADNEEPASPEESRHDTTDDSTHSSHDDSASHRAFDVGSYFHEYLQWGRSSPTDRTSNVESIALSSLPSPVPGSSTQAQGPALAPAQFKASAKTKP